MKLGGNPHLENTIPFVDIFAGPGGLGEGFCGFGDAAGNPVFESVLAAEMDHHAHKTLILRSFFRTQPKGQVPESYYQYIAGKSENPFTDDTLEAWERAKEKNLCVKLGSAEGDLIFDKKMQETLDEKATGYSWVGHLAKHTR